MVQSVQLRSLNHEPEYDASAEAIFGDAVSADDALLAIEYQISRETDFSRYPVVGITSNQGPLYAMNTFATATAKAVVVFFTVDEDHATLHDIIEAEDAAVQLASIRCKRIEVLGAHGGCSSRAEPQYHLRGNHFWHIQNTVVNNWFILETPN